MRNSRLKSTAYHEAGHAVATYLLRISIIKISIIKAEDSYGRVIQKPLPKNFDPSLLDSWSARRRLECLIISSLAGRAAEEILTGKENIKGASHDYHSAIVLVDEFISDNSEIEAYLNWLYIRTKNLLQNKINWGMVECLAGELLDKKEMSKIKVLDVLKSYQKSLLNR